MGTTWRLPDQTNSTLIHSDKHSGFRPYLLAVPFVVFLVGYFFVAAHTARVRLTSPWTMSGWESEIVVDAWRIVHKQPVYTDPKIGHATHMYGPLGTYVVAPFIKTFGPDGRIPRYIAMVASLLLCASASILLSRRANYRWLTAFIVFSLFYFQFYRIREWATESRPDATSILMVFIALCASYRAINTDSLRAALVWMLAAAVAVVVAFLFKQTSAWMVTVPPLAVLITKPFAVRKMVIALLPVAAVAITIIILKFAFPWVYFYMIEVPRKYPVSTGAWVLAVLETLRFNVVFIVCLIFWGLFRATAQNNSRGDMLEVWMLLTILCASLLGAAGRAKFGGYYNSMLAAYLAMAGFSARVITQCFRLSAEKFNLVWLQILVAGAPILLFLTDIPVTARTLNPGSLALNHGDASFNKIISIAKRLPGKFVSPDDPIIALRAKGFAGRNGECEMDTVGRDKATGFPVPAYFLAEIQDADWVLQINASREPSIPAKDLIQLGFEQTTGIVPSTSVYLLWKRNASAVPF